MSDAGAEVQEATRPADPVELLGGGLALRLACEPRADGLVREPVRVVLYLELHRVVAVCVHLRLLSRRVSRTHKTAAGGDFFPVGRSCCTPGAERVEPCLVAALPSGTVTFLFTDVEGSTQLLHELGAAAYARALAEHRSVLRAAFAAHGGVEVDTQGDAFFVAFARAGDALAAAAQTMAENGPLRVRVGIHTGEPLLTPEGYVGLDVHRAARIAAAGHGGQTIVSQTTRNLVPEVELRDLGEHRLKDLARAERLFQLGADEFPPLRSLYRTNLPVPSWPLVGRQRELAELADLVAGGRRLLTLTGPGGSGKTRLAVQAAAELADAFPGGVFFIPLAPLRRADAVLGTVAAALGLRPGEDVFEQLRDTRVLLVFDNAEHLDGVERFIGELVEAVHDAVVLVTSRARLHVAAEHVFPVDALAPDAACDLFIARAAAAGRKIGRDDLVRAVCARVDNLPLGVELAAARTTTLSPGALLARLERALPVLTGGPRDAPTRQQTLRATIAWSYDLLDESARTLFRRIAIFRGDFSLASAEEVVDAELDAVESLVDHSLLKAVGEDRFLMLETLREFALEQLSPEETLTCRTAHAHHFLVIAEADGPLLTGPEGPDARARLIRELPNLRAALDWFAESEADDFARLVNALWRLWHELGLYQEGRRHALHALALADGRPNINRLNLLRNAYVAHQALGEWDDALPLAEERVELARYIGDPLELAKALSQVATPYHAIGDLDRARTVGIEALDIARHQPDRQVLVSALHNLAVTEQLREDYVAADALLTETVALNRELNAHGPLAHALNNLGQIRVSQGLDESADACSEKHCPSLSAPTAWSSPGRS